MKMLTSDRITGITSGGTYEDLDLELLKIRTEKGMSLIVDKDRWRDLQVGDQIDIGLSI